MNSVWLVYLEKIGEMYMSFGEFWNQYKHYHISAVV